MADYETILVETPVDGVGVIRLNRPKALNALNYQLTNELFTALETFDRDAAIGCIILTGSERTFAAGADIKQMADMSPTQMLAGDVFADWGRMLRISKPIIGAVSGYALGGGCELSMMCDMLVASESAVFGQPEINLGVMPGLGGTQRLTRAVGKVIAMEMNLADRKLNAEEARHYGLVNYVYPVETYMDETIKLAQKVAAMPQVAARLIKAAINNSFELSLAEGLNHEAQSFALLFSTDDQKEGMTAFIEKRKPEWKNR